MQALNFQPDMKLASTQLKQDFQTSVHGLNSGYQDGTSFRKMLEQAQSDNTTEGKNNIETKDEVLEKPAISKDDKTEKFETKTEVVSATKEIAKDDSDVKENLSDVLAEESTEELTGAVKAKVLTDIQDFSAVAEEDADIPDIVTELFEDVALFTEEEQEFTTDEILVAVMTGSSISKEIKTVKPELMPEDNALQEIAVENTTVNVDAKAEPENIKNKKLFGEDGKILVQDLRTENAEKSEEKLITKEAAKDGKYVASVSQTEESQITFTYSKAVEQGTNTVNVEVDASKAVAKEGKVFSNMLANQIESQATELVKSGTLVLKDGGKGTINLILHPEKLGNVKVKLEMSENIITGKFVVQSEEAYNALKTSLPVLKAAFSESGFDTAGFDLSWAGNQNNGGSEQSDKNPQWFKYAEDQMQIYDSDYTDYESTVAFGNDFYRSSRISVVA